LFAHYNNSIKSAASNDMATTLKTRKLYTIRYETDGGRTGGTLGFKARLLPRKAALRVVNRMRHSNVFVYISPLVIKMTPAQVAYMDARYA
jgi:hypothetical protein